VRKLLLTVALLVGVALAAGACDTTPSGYAAQVGGTTISSATLTAALSSAAADPATCEVQSFLGVSSIHGAGSGDETYSSAFAAAVLHQLIETEVMRRQLAAEHLAITPFARAVGVAELDSALTPTSTSSGPSCPGTGATTLQGFTPDFRRQLVDFYAGLSLLIAHANGLELTPAGVGSYAAAHGGAPSITCLSAIVVSSQGSAQTLEADLAKGASFAALARAHSLDTQSAPNGGAIGCAPPAQIAQLAAPLNKIVPRLAVGQASAPVHISTFWAIVLVTSRHALGTVQSAATLLGQHAAAGEAAFRAGLARVDVVVDPAYGSWSRSGATLTVATPAGPSGGLLFNASAVGATGTGPGTGSAGGLGATGG